ncbi:PREDICTED: putative pentatricopeptide repeat-containing protein At5g43820 [Theobroma cacao]|uniref:Pentatricopeptide repeat-containing protein At5g43820 n=1 Tax=Theobroma cacao TaxID=3641 RepID=A0AB32UUS1_THECC|nr:PREDICTED: putative pentatricopeptide repeat-containing protein At5g43820 [Theobroma cacao]XP_017981885.1 PREDICTED: putative pentatricopeptide repeat-containing protein At5g43820 [Theobroma cacao]XP_017981886.1 PREDICTED: putative pentatricopeptide repeat-containing protein At5g43820 [Theobroma cacao]XP_017981887.1 PREDICTED: putative pentatricopeptide repeat-containing protein At5g43820 [Theobroma cacao]XP_017981888.1 PREDICTED: putative pentatricopeptide repeat-containing protein At5g4382
MGFHFHHLHGVSLSFNRARNHLPCINSFSSAFSFSTLSDSSIKEPSFNQISNQSTVDERRVFGELSDLFQFSHSNAIVPYPYRESYPPKQIESGAVDEYLLPEEKLRGVFLQKLRGKTAIEHALSNVPVELSIDIIAKVVNIGNLGGEAMVLFFNWAMKQPGIARDIHSYYIIIKALGRRKFFKFMIETLHDMVKEGIKPDVETLSIVMDSFIRAQRVQKAIETFENLEELGLKRDTKSLNVLLQCLCRRAHVGAANSLFNAVNGKVKFNCDTYNIMISGWSKLGRVSKIERILKAMIADEFTPDCSTFSYLIEGLGRAGRIDDAVEIFDHMKEKGCIPDTRVYNAMISNFISVGNFDECMKYYKGLLNSNSDPDVDTYTKLISAFLKAQNVADALEIFDEMLVQGIVPTTGTLTSFVEPLCSYGPPYAAMMFYKKARKFGCKISLSAYKLLLMRLSRFGKCGMLLNIWDEMQESGHTSDMEVYEHVINGLCNIGHLENAVLVMEEALRKGFCPSRVLYSKLNNKLLASNEVEKAYKLFLKIKNARRDENARRYWRANGWHF